MPSRRNFLLTSAALAGGLGLAIGYREWSLPPRLPKSIELEPGQIALTPYVVVDHDGIKLIAPRAEMGQGIHTTLAALVAEELDVELASVTVIHGPPSELYSNSVAFGKPRYPGRVHGRPTQFTGGQSSIKDAFVKMRKAGAATRDLLLRAAAETWHVDAKSLTIQNGNVVNPTGEQLSYIALAPVAAKLDLHPDPPLKPDSKWKILGKPQARIDMVSKSTGTAKYAIDQKFPGMLYATVKINPNLGGAMKSFDATKALKLRGVKKIVPLSNGVAVVATNTWYAFRASQTIEFNWGAAEYPDSTAEHQEVIRGEFSESPSYQALNIGDADQYLGSKQSIEGEYSTPYLAHATMEPMSATALFKSGQLDIWAGTQNPTNTRKIAASLAGVNPDNVNVHITLMGGGFGRRLDQEFVEYTVKTALSLEGVPVNVTWTREEDMSHDVYRPMAIARFRAHVADNQPVALDIKVSSLSLYESARAKKHRPADPEKEYFVGEEKFLTTGVKDQPYKIPNYRVTAYKAPRLLPVGFWRGVGESQNSFFHESIMDELAYAAGQDPLEMRLQLLDHAPSRTVLETVATMSNWGSSRPVGHALGVAYVLSSGAATAQVIEIKQTPQGIKIIKAYAAVDVGYALDPRIIESQVEGSLLYGLTAAIAGEITVTKGVVDQLNFDQYELLRMSNSPPVEVKIIASKESIYGAGESGLSCAAPALGNAIYAATGLRIRDLPFRKSIDFV